MYYGFRLFLPFSPLRNGKLGSNPRILVNDSMFEPFMFDVFENGMCLKTACFQLVTFGLDLNQKATGWDRLLEIGAE